jgi:hypothetical protein
MLSFQQKNQKQTSINNILFYLRLFLLCCKIAFELLQILVKKEIFHVLSSFLYICFKFSNYY